MNDTFFLSNIVPQDGNNNSGYWNQLEGFCRHLSTKYDHVCIISGPLFLPLKDTVHGASKKHVSYEVNKIRLFSSILNIPVCYFC
jgi:nuclease EXOG, mitochondrial